MPERGAPEGGPESIPEGGRPDPPPLRPFGLVLHRDGSWTHEGQPIRHARLREVFDRSVRFFPGEGEEGDPGEGGLYAVQIGRFRGRIEVEEAAFFVREFDAPTGRLRLSDGSWEGLEVASLRTSSADGGLLCTVKRDLAPAGLPARFTHAAQAELMGAAEEGPEGPGLRLQGRYVRLPEL